MIIRRMREQIIASGGEVHFATRMTELLIEGGQVRGAIAHTGEVYLGPVILATGHSARDVYCYLHQAGILSRASPSQWECA